MRRICFVVLLVLYGCTTKVSEAERTADFKAVIVQVLTKSEFRRYLSPPESGALIFHYAELPVYNGVAMAKPSFDVLGPEEQLIHYSTNMAEENANVLLIVDRIIIDHDSAEVILSISKSRLSGGFKLARDPHSTWLVTRAVISQS